MKCPKCGSDIPPNSKFCLSCGTSVEMSRSAARELIHAEKVRKRGIGFLAVAAAVLIVAVIILLMNMGRGRVMAPPTPELPVVTVTKPPQEIVDYIAHVKSIEDRRLKMKNDMGPALDMLKAATEMKYDFNEETHTKKEEGIKTGLEDYTKKWQDIVTSFNSVPPPPGCEKLANAYAIALGKYSGAMISIQQAFYEQDLGTLMSMQGAVQVDVDNALVQSDQELAAVLKKYNIPKRFSIVPDKQGDSLLIPNM